MKRVFADTGYYLAAINPADEHHQKAREWTDRGDAFVVSTGFVLLEFADFVARWPKTRRLVRELRSRLASNPKTLLIPLSEDLLNAAMELYAGRDDKEWSLTDCTSFVVMEREGIKEALTADHHFQQAGFKSLLL